MCVFFPSCLGPLLMRIEFLVPKKGLNWQIRMTAQWKCRTCDRSSFFIMCVWVLDFNFLMTNINRCAGAWMHPTMIQPRPLKQHINNRREYFVSDLNYFVSPSFHQNLANILCVLLQHKCLLRFHCPQRTRRFATQPTIPCECEL